MGRRGLHGGPYDVGGGGDEGGPVPLVVVLTHQREARLLARLEASSRLRTAAIIGDTFNLDPVFVLEEDDALRRLVRIAAHNVVQDETRKAQQRAAGK